MTYEIVTKTGDRSINEDSVKTARSGGGYMFVVADGLGGHGGGEIASAIAAEAFEREFKNADDNAAFLTRAFESAQNDVLSAQKERRSNDAMKTTVAALSVIGGRCAWGHIGDSRVYLFRRNKVKKRTLDHSVPQKLALIGEIKESDIPGHPDRSRVLAAIGDEWQTPKYELSEEISLSACQAFLLCTDGFWEHLTEAAMTASLKKSRDVGEWLSAMTAEVEKNALGSVMDNYTAIAVAL
jgi:serine/threonine protein phosphatase PrpC